LKEASSVVESWLKMKKLKFLITFTVLSALIASCIISYNFFRPDFSKNQCEAIRENFGKIKTGMDKEEVESLLSAKVRSKIYPYTAVFPEQQAQWEIWMLCADLNSCIFVASLGREQCYKWHMIAFDTQTGKVVKVFSDSPDRVGFT